MGGGNVGESVDVPVELRPDPPQWKSRIQEAAFRATSIRRRFLAAAWNPNIMHCWLAELRACLTAMMR